MDKASLNANTMLSTLLPQAVKKEQKPVAQNSQPKVESQIEKPKSPAAATLNFKKPSIGVLNPGNINTNYSVNDIFQKKKVDETSKTDKLKNTQTQQGNNGDPAALGLTEVKQVAKQGGLLAKDMVKLAVLATGTLLGGIALKTKGFRQKFITIPFMQVSCWFKSGEAKEALIKKITNLKKSGGKAVETARGKAIPFFKEQSLRSKNLFNKYLTTHDELKEFFNLIGRTNLKPQNVSIPVNQGDKALLSDILAKFKTMAENFSSHNTIPKIQVRLNSADDALIKELEKFKPNEGIPEKLLESISQHASNVSISYDKKGLVGKNLEGINNFIDEFLTRNKELEKFLEERLGISTVKNAVSGLNNINYEFVDTVKQFMYTVKVNSLN